jgi:regulator of sirC expression with transglutaminase-like and TPR domain
VRVAAGITARRLARPRPAVTAHRSLAQQLADAADRPGPDLAAPAFLIARLEYPRLDPEPYLDRLDAMGDAAFHRIETDPGHDAPLAARVDALNRYLFTEVGFFGNREQYEDPRNSCLNEVIERRTGIPITLALVYIEVARRAGLRSEGINFPGHFLVRVLHDLHTDDQDEGLIVDPFHAGAVLDEHDCRKLLNRHVGEEAAWQPGLLARATRRQILVRMLLNLKRLYVRWRSFPQARHVADLLLRLTPSAVTELRDRGLLAYHMNDFPAALKDLEHYLKLAALGDDEADEEQRKDTEQVWEHVKALRRRVASLN